MRLIETFVCGAALLISAAEAQSPDTAFQGQTRIFQQQEVSPTIDTRAVASESAILIYSGRMTVARTAKTEDEAWAQVEQAITATRTSKQVSFFRMRREAGRQINVYPPMPPRTEDSPPPLPQQPSKQWTESATVDVEAKNRDELLAWAASMQPPPLEGQAIGTVYTPTITERTSDDDPAWTKAAAEALELARADGRIAAKAAGGELGKMLRIGIQRRPTVVDGKVEVTVTAQFVMNPPKR